MERYLVTEMTEMTSFFGLESKTDDLKLNSVDSTNPIEEIIDEEDVYAIHEDNMERLEKKLNRIANKCKEYGCEFNYEKVGERFAEVETSYGREIARFILVKASGVARVKGWEFVARIEHTDKDINIITGYSEIKIPEHYRTTDPYCDHCKSNRRRNDTFLIFNRETGEYKQVGRNCLADFTGGLSAAHVANYISFFDELIQGRTPAESFGTGRSYYKVEDVILLAAEVVRTFGYVKTTKKVDAGDIYYGGWDTIPNKDNTRDKVSDYYQVLFRFDSDQYEADIIRKEMSEVGFDLEKSKQFATEAHEWILNKDIPEDDNYSHNLQAAASQEYIAHRNLGVLVSLIPAYNYHLREIERIQRAEENPTKHVGEIGERITVDIEKYEIITTWNTEWGTTILYRFIDTDGNELIWKTGKWLQEEKPVTTILKDGSELTRLEPYWPEYKSITGTVKDHTVFNFVKQTELTRCKVHKTKQAK